MVIHIMIAPGKSTALGIDIACDVRTTACINRNCDWRGVLVHLYRDATLFDRLLQSSTTLFEPSFEQITAISVMAPRLIVLD